MIKIIDIKKNWVLDLIIFFGLGVYFLLISLNKIQIINIVALIFLLYITILTKSVKKIVIIQFILLFSGTFFIDSLWLGTGFEINLNYKYIIDLINFIILIIICTNKKMKKVIKDPIIIIIGMWIIFEFIVYILNARMDEFVYFLNGIRIYFRFIVLYLAIKIIKFNDYKLEKKIRTFSYLQLVLVVIQSATWPISQDNFTGTFGINGTLNLSIFLSIYIFYSFSRFLIYGEKTYMLYALSLMIVFMLNETKIALVLIPIIYICILLILKYKLVKKIKILFLIICSMIIGINLFFDKYPEFKHMFSKQFIEMYVIKNNNVANYDYSRIGSIKYINDFILNTDIKKMIGVGLGGTFINDNDNYKYDAKGRSIGGISSSIFYEKNNRLGYEISSATNMYLEVGIIGISIYFCVILILLKRGFKLYKSIDKNNRCIGVCSIMFNLYWIIAFIYGNIFFSMLPSCIFWSFNGYISKKYYDTK